MIAIVDYRAGNLTSVRLAFEALDMAAEITNSREKILAADRVVFPGVGAAGSAMQTLNELGLIETITEIVGNGTPFLGICLGTQIVLQRSEEDNGVDCIGLIPGTVKAFAPSDAFDKVPQMGWNSVVQRVPHPLFEGIRDKSEFYFVHSYYPSPSREENILGETEYAGVRFASVLGKDNVVATQFHPEKSGRTGLRFLENFCRWSGESQPC